MESKPGASWQIQDIPSGWVILAKSPVPFTPVTYRCRSRFVLSFVANGIPRFVNIDSTIGAIIARLQKED